MQERILTRPVDIMRPAHLDLSPGLFSPGYRAQSLNLYLATRENAGKTPFAPVQAEKEEFLQKLEDTLFDQMPDPGFKVTEDRRFRIQEKNSVLFFPLSLVEIREGSQIRLLLLDSVGGGLIRQLRHNEMEDLLDNLGIKESRSPGETRLKLAPLICPECAGELDPDPKAYLRFCLNCSRGWGEKKGRLVEKECLWTGSPPGGAGGDQDTTYLPFWMRRGGGRSLFVPAFGVRSPRLLYNLVVRYYHAGFPVHPIPYRDRLHLHALPVRLSPGGADEIADVVSQTSSKELFVKKGTRQSLLLVPFRKRGPDLVGPKGLAVPVSSLGALS